MQDRVENGSLVPILTDCMAPGPDVAPIHNRQVVDDHYGGMAFGDEGARCAQLLADPNQEIEVPGLGDRAPRRLSRQALAGVIEPRVEEIYSLVHQVIRESGFEELLSSGIVITGGAAVMPGMIELGEDIFLKPVRKGTPTYRGALHDMVANPRSATVMGLLEEARLAGTWAEDILDFAKNLAEKAERTSTAPISSAIERKRLPTICSSIVTVSSVAACDHP